MKTFHQKHEVKKKKKAPYSLIRILLFTSSSYLVYSRLVPVHTCFVVMIQSCPYIIQADPKSHALSGMHNIPYDILY